MVITSPRAARAICWRALWRANGTGSWPASRSDVLNSAPGNPDAITFAGISTAHGTSAQMLATINSGITYGGIWLNVPDND